MRMELLLSLRFQVFSLNSAITLLTHGIIQLVVMAVTIWMIINDIKRGRHERLGTGFADETLAMVSAESTEKSNSVEMELTLPMIPSCQSTIRRTDGFPFDDFTTAFAVALVSRSCPSARLWCD